MVEVDGLRRRAMNISSFIIGILGSGESIIIILFGKANLRDAVAFLEIPLPIYDGKSLGWR